MQAQDAFGRGPRGGMENVVEFEVADYGDYTVVNGRNGSFSGGASNPRRKDERYHRRAARRCASAPR